MAFNQARHYAQSLNGWLLLQGGYGCGKTHLAAAIANYAVGMGVPTLFLTVPDLLDTLRFAYNAEDTTFEERFDEIRNAKLLVLDDFGTQNATGWAQEKLFQIVNYRYINKLPTVVTTNLLLDEIEAAHPLAPCRPGSGHAEPHHRSRLPPPDGRRRPSPNSPRWICFPIGPSNSFSLRKDEDLQAQLRQILEGGL